MKVKDVFSVKSRAARGGEEIPPTKYWTFRDITNLTRPKKSSQTSWLRSTTPPSSFSLVCLVCRAQSREIIKNFPREFHMRSRLDFFLLITDTLFTVVARYRNPSR